MDKTLMFNLVNAMCVNFDLDKNKTQVQEYCRVVHPFLTKAGVTDKMFEEAVGMFISKTSGSNFNKLPSVGDFLGILNLKPKSIEDKAADQAQECISNADRMRWSHYVQYDDPTTNWVLEKAFGGVSKFCWMLDDSNESKSDSVWVKKRFVDEYLTAASGSKQILHPIKNPSATFISHDKILKLGDESVCDANKQLAIENAQKQKEVNSFLTKITKKDNNK